MGGLDSRIGEEPAVVMKLGEWLIEEGRLAAPQLDQALRSQRTSGGAIGTHLVQLGFLTEEELVAALARIHGVEGVSRPELLAAPAEVVALLSAEFATRHLALPFRIAGEDLHLAMQNPADSLAVHEAAFLTGFDIVPHIAPEIVLLDGLARHHRVASGMLMGEKAPSPSTPGSPSASGSLSRPGSVSIILVAEKLSSAMTREEVLESVMEALADSFERVAIFAVRGRQAAMIQQRHLPGTARREDPFPIPEGSFLGQVSSAGGFRFGAVPETEANRPLIAVLGGQAPAASLAAAIRLRDRTVALLYGDRLTKAGISPPPSRVQKLQTMTALALEAVILRQKILRTAESKSGAV